MQAQVEAERAVVSGAHDRRVKRGKRQPRCLQLHSSHDRFQGAEKQDGNT